MTRHDTNDEHAPRGSRVVAMLLGAGVLAVAGAHVRRPLPADTLVNLSAPEWSMFAPPAVTIDLNRATTAELSLLPGVGPVLAARIVESRERDGAFDAPGDLARVKGIGPVRVRQLREHGAASE